jgi:hypothetical protein
MTDNPGVFVMPSLFRFLFITGSFTSIVCGGLFILATYFEPDLQEVRKAVPGVKILKK